MDLDGQAPKTKEYHTEDFSDLDSTTQDDLDAVAPALDTDGVQSSQVSLFLTRTCGDMFKVTFSTNIMHKADLSFTRSNGRSITQQNRNFTGFTTAFKGTLFHTLYTAFPTRHLKPCRLGQAITGLWLLWFTSISPLLSTLLRI